MKAGAQRKISAHVLKVKTSYRETVVESEEDRPILFL